MTSIVIAGGSDEAVVHREEFAAQQIHRVEEHGTELGFVVIDSSIGGRSRGGLRLAQDVTALELRSAARAMTLKYGLLGLPQGGAKAGLHGDPDAPLHERRDRMLAFARPIEPLLRAGVYVPDADLGTQADDIGWMMRALGLPVGRYDWRANRSGEYTAVSCVAAARAALAVRGKSLSGCRVAVEGFGSVGSAVADRLRRAGACIVAVSTSVAAVYDPAGLDIDRALQLASSKGSRLIEAYPSALQLKREQLLELPVDLLCPCARYHSIHMQNVVAVAAPVICGGANNPVSPEAERYLVERDVLCVPDFISSCGGVLGGTLEFAGVSRTRIVSIIDAYVFETVAAFVDLAQRRHTSLRAVAEPLALSRHGQVRAAAESSGLGNRMLRMAIELYRRGWVPRQVVAALAPHQIMQGAVKIDMPPSAEDMTR